MSDEQPPRQLSDADLPEPLGHIFRMIERLAEQVTAADAATQRKIEFILAQQARSETRVDRVERVAKLLVRAGRRARREMRVQDERLAALIGTQEKNAEAIARLAESQAHSDRRLDALIDIVREGRNGKGGEK